MGKGEKVNIILNRRKIMVDEGLIYLRKEDVFEEEEDECDILTIQIPKYFKCLSA